ncbi:hypothetical protein [Streptomyces alanosinicus]|uniref:Uncharacterized protein n=1 Tax=Streptomyces alanosinicus TaxID=68171 RepID=A0A918YMT6_9ACTN|nr:hypothetical protein [Streptomyces alanosinicus]GHE09746.1 hypothetical protein GCM10010339_63210 [Streptomyces alanosinicus]
MTHALVGDVAVVHALVEDPHVVVEQGELLGEEHGGQFLACHGAWCCGRQMRTYPFHKHLRASASGVAVPAGERLHPLGTDTAGLLTVG